MLSKRDTVFLSSPASWDALQPLRRVHGIHRHSALRVDSNPPPHGRETLALGQHPRLEGAHYPNNTLRPPYSTNERDELGAQPPQM